jgi:hypothetical protein
MSDELFNFSFLECGQLFFTNFVRTECFHQTSNIFNKNIITCNHYFLLTLIALSSGWISTSRWLWVLRTLSCNRLWCLSSYTVVISHFIRWSLLCATSSVRHFLWTKLTNFRGSLLRWMLLFDQFVLFVILNKLPVLIISSGCWSLLWFDCRTFDLFLLVILITITS